MNREKKLYMIRSFVTAAVALVLLAVIMYLLLRPISPTGVYSNAELESSIEFGDDLSVKYKIGEKTYKGNAVKRGSEYRSAVTDGDREFILTISVGKGYISVSDGETLQDVVFSR